MRSKTNDFFLAAASSDYDVIVLTETWLRSDVSNSELAQNYNIYRCDRSHDTSRRQRGGGVLIAVKSSMESVPVRLDGCESLEQVAVKVSLGNKYFFVCGIYLRPRSKPECYIQHSKAIQQILNAAATCDFVLVVGDYNLPYLSWCFDENIGGLLPTKASSKQQLESAERLVASGLKQICDIRNINGRLLDLAFVNSVCSVEVIEAPTTMLKPDRHHKPFVFRLDIRRFEDSSTDTEWDFYINRYVYDAVCAEASLSRQSHSSSFSDVFWKLSPSRDVT